MTFDNIEAVQNVLSHPTHHLDSKKVHTEPNNYAISLTNRILPL